MVTLGCVFYIPIVTSRLSAFAADPARWPARTRDLAKTRPFASHRADPDRRLGDAADGNDRVRQPSSAQDVRSGRGPDLRSRSGLVPALRQRFPTPADEAWSPRRRGLAGGDAVPHRERRCASRAGVGLPLARRRGAHHALHPFLAGPELPEAFGVTEKPRVLRQP